MMRKRKIIIWTEALALALLLWVPTGGLVIVRHDWIFPQGNSQTGYQPLIELDFSSRFRTSGVPFLCTYIAESEPFDLQVSYITHNLPAAPELHVDKFVIEYKDGTVVDLTDQIRWPLKPETAQHRYIHGDGVNQKKPSVRATCNLSRCMPKREAFVLRVATRLCSGGEVVETLDSSIPFVHHRQHSIMTTWWWYLLKSA
jgi:hypothetical protein